jgi:hypothetical protein
MHAHESEEIAGGFPLNPQLVSRTAKEGNAPRALGAKVCLLVHVSKHQHLAGVGMLHDGRDKSVDIILNHDDLHSKEYQYYTGELRIAIRRYTQQYISDGSGDVQ